MRMKYHYVGSDCRQGEWSAEIRDRMNKAEFQKTLKACERGPQQIGWISIRDLVDEHIISYDYTTFRWKITDQEREDEVIAKIFPEICEHASRFGYVVTEIGTGLDHAPNYINKAPLTGIYIKAVHTGRILAAKGSEDMLPIMEI